MEYLPETGFVRLHQIIGQKAVSEEEAEANRKRGVGPKKPRKMVPPIIPVGRSKWLDGVSKGLYPQPVRTLGPRICAWRVEDIKALIESVARNAVGAI